MTSLDRRLPPGFLAEALRADALSGLTAEPKSLPPKWFYDAQGSALFDKITELPEYYPTRAEREILRATAAVIAGQTRARTLIELGSGSSDKTRLLLDALRAAGTLRCYVPVDVSEPALAAAGKALSAEYPGLDVRAVVSDFEERLGFPADGDAPAPRLVAFLGSTIGNLEPDQRAAFLARVRAQLRPGDFFLLGTDLVKDEATLIGLLGVTVGLARGGLGLFVTVLAVLLEVLFCITLAWFVTAALAGLLRSRRGKDFAAFLIIPIFALYEVFTQVVPKLTAEGKLTPASFAASICGCAGFRRAWPRTRSRTPRMGTPFARIRRWSGCRCSCCAPPGTVSRWRGSACGSPAAWPSRGCPTSTRSPSVASSSQMRVLIG